MSLKHLEEQDTTMPLWNNIRPYYQGTGTKAEMSVVYPGQPWEYSETEAVVLQKLRESGKVKGVKTGDNHESTALTFETPQQANIASTTLEFNSFPAAMYKSQLFLNWLIHDLNRALVTLENR